MVARFAMLIACLLAASPALAQTMNAETARRFVVGKLFSFDCFDGAASAASTATAR